ncbi:MAG: hypothetical protein HY097_11190 [Nitrospinae bacterium]|nr:hypothetical protein [Nitrospinota bacterium]MBI3815010.1 hypothetical protein [Nitrospinota bacterium]
MILGHYANTYVAHNLLKRYNIELNLYLLIFGAYLPDLIDKPLNIFFHLPGRGIAHSVVIQALLFAPLIYILPRHKKFFISIWSGCILHLIQDAIAIYIAFWPIVGDLSDHRRFSIAESFYSYYIEMKYPYTLLTEAVSFIIWGGILLYKWLPEWRELAEERVKIRDGD